MKDPDDTYGEWKCLDWYDGPLSEIAVVKRHGKYPGTEIELKTVRGWVGEEHSTDESGEKFYFYHVRLQRYDLEAMLKLLVADPVDTTSILYQRGEADGRRGHPPAELTLTYLRGYAAGWSNGPANTKLDNPSPGY